jgi:Zn-dependent metalloprotease
MTQEPFKDSSTDTASGMHLPKQLQNTEHQKDMKLSSIDWLIEQLTEVERNLINKTYLQNNNSLAGRNLRELFEQAKAMHKDEQLNTAYDFYYGKCSIEDFYDYYQETFNTNEK